MSAALSSSSSSSLASLTSSASPKNITLHDAGCSCGEIGEVGVRDDSCKGKGNVGMCDGAHKGTGEAAGACGGRGDAVGEGAYELVDEPVSRKDACCTTRSVGHGSSG